MGVPVESRSPICLGATWPYGAHTHKHIATHAPAQTHTHTRSKCYRDHSVFPTSHTAQERWDNEKMCSKWFWMRRSGAYWCLDVAGKGMFSCYLFVCVCGWIQIPSQIPGAGVQSRSFRCAVRDDYSFSCESSCDLTRHLSSRMWAGCVRGLSAQLLSTTLSPGHLALSLPLVHVMASMLLSSYFTSKVVFVLQQASSIAFFNSNNNSVGLSVCWQASWASRKQVNVSFHGFSFTGEVGQLTHLCHLHLPVCFFYFCLSFLYVSAPVTTSGRSHYVFWL